MVAAAAAAAAAAEAAAEEDVVLDRAELARLRGHSTRPFVKDLLDEKLKILNNEHTVSSVRTCKSEEVDDLDVEELYVLRDVAVRKRVLSFLNYSIQKHVSKLNTEMGLERPQLGDCSNVAVWLIVCVGTIAVLTPHSFAENNLNSLIGCLLAATAFISGLVCMFFSILKLNNAVAVPAAGVCFRALGTYIVYSVLQSDFVSVVGKLGFAVIVVITSAIMQLVYIYENVPSQ